MVEVGGAEDIPEHVKGKCEFTDSEVAGVGGHSCRVMDVSGRNKESVEQVHLATT